MNGLPDVTLYAKKQKKDTLQESNKSSPGIPYGDMGLLATKLTVGISPRVFRKHNCYQLHHPPRL
jgi:hypothetical protein